LERRTGDVEYTTGYGVPDRRRLAHRRIGAHR
jgi:hypothetical protein